MAKKLPVNQQQIKAALLSYSIAGRFEYHPGNPAHILDVAHNTDSIACLAELLEEQPCGGKTLAVVGMLEDKTHADALIEIAPKISEWFIADLEVPRGMKAAELAAVVEKLDNKANVACFDSVKQAVEAADSVAESADRIVVFGSFYTVEFAMQLGI